MFEFKVCIAWPMEIPHWFANHCHEPEEVGRAELNVATPSYATVAYSGSVQFFRNLPYWITKLLVIYSIIHKRVFTPPQDLTTRIIEAIDHSSISSMAFTKKFTSGIFCKCKCHCRVWRMIDSLYYSSRKIPERCENSFVNYRIDYQNLC